jgi:hypothetical protein
MPTRLQFAARIASGVILVVIVVLGLAYWRVRIALFGEKASR